MRRQLKFALFLIGALLAGPTFADSAVLTWTAPTLNCDGTPLTNLASFKVYWGTVGRVAAGLPPTSSGGCSDPSQVYTTEPKVATAYEKPQQTSPVGTTGLTITLPDDGKTYFFTVTAIDAAGAESPISNEMSKIANAPPVPFPGPVSATFTWTVSVPVAFDAAFNFRQTRAFVTDGAGQLYVGDNVANGARYPVTMFGRQVGWVNQASPGTRDRSSTVDVRLAGINQVANQGGGISRFRVDLPGPGIYDIRFAVGDMGYGQTNFVRVYDNTTQFININGVNTNPGEFVDASGAKRSTTGWGPNNIAVRRTFTSSTFFIEIGDPAQAGPSSSCLAHLRITGG